MFLCEYLLSFCIIGTFVSINAKEIDAAEYDMSNSDIYLMEDEPQEQAIQKLEIKLYYESLCRGSREFVTMELAPTVEKLGRYLDVKIYPYGHAQTTLRGGTYDFKCQHGYPECYRNKLHACSIHHLGNMTEAVRYISCMMDTSQPYNPLGDGIADKCGSKLKINSEPIKQCAKSDQGNDLLKYYGDESMEANFNYVPFILINNIAYDDMDFMRDVCSAFKVPPPPCRN